MLWSACISEKNQEHDTSGNREKSLVQSLVLSKLNFNDTVTYPLPIFLQKRMQRVQNAAAGFVLNRYCSEEDVLNLGWLPTLENTQLNILKLGHRALYNKNWPEYLTLSRNNPIRTLRSSSTPLRQISLPKGTFQDSVANLYNDLPASITSITDYHHFVKESAKIAAGLISMSGNFIILIFMILYLSVNNM